MLWRAIQIPKNNPSLTSLLDKIKVIIPSGTLWMIIAIIEKIPTRYKLSTSCERSLSRIEKVNIPKAKDNIIKKTPNKTPYVENKYSNDEGKRSRIEIDVIIPAAKAKEQRMILSLLFIFRKGINPPISVEIPAIKVIIKLIINSFILKHMKKKMKYTHLLILL